MGQFVIEIMDPDNRDSFGFGCYCNTSGELLTIKVYETQEQAEKKLREILSEARK